LGRPMSGNALRFLHIVQHKNGTRSVPGCIPTRSVGNDQWAAGGDWSAGRSPSLAGQLPQGFVYICRRLVGCQAAIVGTPPGAARSHRGWVHNLKKMVDCLHLPLLTRRKGGSYVRGEKTGMDTRPDRSPPAHSRHNALTGSEQAGGDYSFTEIGVSQKLETQLPTRQPEKCVGKRCVSYTSLNTKMERGASRAAFPRGA
jgi:hypothetical protein